ncbi:hypothetical protein FRC01_007801 [Tulasnella sp. 417]|nr:hypothetical protein FRC01_007801 [Tulasnella sp. 417]
MSVQGADNGVWGGANITEAALEIRSAISSPTCQTKDTCIDFVEAEIPRCLGANGAAACWCSPDSPLLSCAECMAHPTDASTSFDQTEAATKGILGEAADHIISALIIHLTLRPEAYQAGCQAYAAYLSGSTTLSIPAATASSASPLPTIPSPAHPSTGLSSGAISGIVSGSVSFISLCIFIGYVWYKRSQDSHRIAPVVPTVVQRREAPANQEFVGPIRVMTHASGTRIDLDGGPDQVPRRPPRRGSRASDQV